MKNLMIILSLSLAATGCATSANLVSNEKDIWVNVRDNDWMAKKEVQLMYCTSHNKETNKLEPTCIPVDIKN